MHSGVGALASSDDLSTSVWERVAGIFRNVTNIIQNASQHCKPTLMKSISILEQPHTSNDKTMRLQNIATSAAADANRAANSSRILCR